MKSHQCPRRLFAACFRCHSLEIKCSGDKPCKHCLQSDNAPACDYPRKERKVIVSQRYLDDLKNENKRLRELGRHEEASGKENLTTGSFSPQSDGLGRYFLSPEEINMHNLLFEAQNGSIISDIPSVEPVFIGEASCAAFANRLMQCLNRSHPQASAAITNYYQTRTVHRVLDDSEYELPDRVEAKLFMNIAWNFIGTYHHLYLRDHFVKEVDAVYRKELNPTVIWMSKFYALMALGNLYSNRQNPDQRIPGLHSYSQAMQMLQDAQEECSVMQVEVLAMLAWYTNTLGRARSSHFLFGVAMKMAMVLGMHRSAGSRSTLSNVERENRRRVWWALYFYERMSASKLGQPVTVRDEDIDVEIPSNEGLTPEEAQNFADPAHICANVGLAQILGDILTDIYGLPRLGDGTYVQRVHGILKRLRAWNENLPSTLQLRKVRSPRPVSSLNLAYNECIIQATRPILLHLFNTQLHLSQTGEESSSQTFSSITLALAEDCVNAAMSSSRVLEEMYIDGSIATFGYWDAQYNFSATLILTISAAMNPRTATSDALETLVSILRSMREQGNIPAGEYCERLGQIQATMSHLRCDSATQEQDLILPKDPIGLSSFSINQAHMELTDTAQVQSNTSEVGGNVIGSDKHSPHGHVNFHHALAGPLIDSFLYQTYFSWTDASISGETAGRDLALTESYY